MFTPLTTEECAPDSFWTVVVTTKVKDNFDDLNARAGSGGGGSGSLVNGSFELDSDDDDVPDGWTVSLYSAGSQSLNTTTPAHGAKALQFTHPGGSGNGGGYATGDYFEVDELAGVDVQGLHWCSAAGMHCRVALFWYTAAKGACGTPSTTLYDSTSNPTSPTLGKWHATPPSTARYAKLRIYGGMDDTNVAGDANFDGFEVGRGAYVAGDNTLIASMDEKSTTSTTPAKMKSIQIDKPGTLRITFYLKRTGSTDTAYAQIYRQTPGSSWTAVGTLRSCTSITQYSEDISGWSAGDRALLFAYISGSSGDSADVSEFCINTQAWGACVLED